VRGHVSRDPLKYRAQGETEEKWKCEPIGRCASWLRDQGISEGRIRAAEATAKQRIAEAIAEAKTAPFPEPHLAFTDVQDVGGAYG
jgi:TPP-dependent pyruvate/acetoin dehydrogenase alpha subunit